MLRVKSQTNWVDELTVKVEVCSTHLSKWVQDLRSFTEQLGLSYSEKMIPGLDTRKREGFRNDPDVG